MITAEQAADIARARAAENEWGLTEPVSVTFHKRWNSIVHRKSRGARVFYEVVSDPALRGTKSRFIIHAETGAILHEGYIPR